MSNFLSSPYQVQAPQSAVDTAQVAKTLSTLQGKFDTNTAIIAQTIAAYNTKLQSLRSLDNEYIASRLKEVTNTVDAYKAKNGNLALSSTRDSILTAVTSLMDDPLIQDAVSSTQNKKNFDAQYQATAKKDPKLANPINYQDALDQAGFTDYMQGKSKRLGSMTYTPYTDVQKELNDRVSKWAKENGYHTMVNSVNKGMYFENTKGTYLTKDEIIKFIDVNVDPVLSNQMNINARQSFGKLSDKSFSEVARIRYQKDVNEDSVTLAAEKAKLKTASGVNAEIVTQNIAYLEKNIADKNEKLRTNTFDRNSQYEFYKQDLYNGLADAYDKADITDIDYDTTPLDIAKFGFEQQKFATETALKEQELKLKKYELDNKNSQGISNALGTEIPVVPEDGEEPKPAEDLLRDDFIRTESELRATLQREDPEYKKLKNLQERNNYIRELMKTGGKVNPNSNSPLTVNLANAVNSHKNNYKVYSEYVNGIKNNIEPLVEDQYNDMAKARNLNLNNLSSSMPFTSQLLKSTKSFDKLTPIQQELVRYERVINQLQFDDDLSTSERKALTTYISQVKKRNATNSFFQTNIQNLGTPEEVGGATKNFWTNVVYGTGLKGAKNVLDLGADLVGYGYDTIAGNNAQENWQKSRVEESQDWRNVAGNWKTFKKALGDTFPLTDTNITEVDTGEDSGSGRDLSQTLRSSLEPSLRTITNTINANRPNVQDKQSFSFSTENKGQEPIANLIGQVIQKQTGEVPATTKNNYNLEYFAGAKEFKVTYLDEDNKQKEAIISEALMPSNIKNMYGASAGNWATSVKNPNAALPSMTLNKPSSNEEAWKMVDNLSKISEDNFNAVELDKIRSTILLTPEEKIRELSKTYSTLVQNPQVVQEITNLLNSNVEVESKRLGDMGFKVYPVITVNGKRQALDTQVDGLFKVIPEYNPSNYLKIQLMIIDETYNSKINEIIRRNNIK